MMSEQQSVELESLIDESRGISYGVVQPGVPDEEGVPIVRVQNLVGGRIDCSDVLKVSPEVEAKYRRSRLRGGELLLSVVGSVGNTAIVPPSLAGWNTARAVAVLPLRDSSDATYVKYCLDWSETRELMEVWCNTTVQATLNLKEVAEIPIPFPPKPTRDAIARILGALDDKIELNRRMNRTLEVLAQKLFKSWFVDFDPVVAKSQNRKPFGLSDDIAALFPDAFEDSELGPVPKGWCVESLDTLAEFRNGLAMQKFPPGLGASLPVLKIAELRAGSTNGADQASADLDPRFVVNDGDLIFSWSGSLMVDVWAGGKAALNQHLFKVVPNDVPQWFCHYWLLEHLEDFQGIAADKATTMGHIRRHHLSDAEIVRPDEKILARADAVIAPLCERVLQNKLQSRKLAAMRDLLLPKLLSGEIRVPVAEKAVETALL